MSDIKSIANSWAKDELIPFLDYGEDLLGLPVDRLVLAAIARRAAQSGIELEFLLQEVKHHYKHQVGFIRSNSH